MNNLVILSQFTACFWIMECVGVWWWKSGSDVYRWAILFCLNFLVFFSLNLIYGESMLPIFVSFVFSVLFFFRFIFEYFVSFLLCFWLERVSNGFSPLNFPLFQCLSPILFIFSESLWCLPTRCVPRVLLHRYFLIHPCTFCLSTTPKERNYGLSVAVLYIIFTLLTQKPASDATH